MASITPTIYWAINGTELQLGNSSISGTYSGNFAGNTEFTENSQPWHSYKDTITSVDILSNISIGSGAYFFSNLKYCTEIKNISRLDTSKVTNMSYMFIGCGYSSTNFKLDLFNFDTSNVIDMSYMFYSCGYSSTNFTLDLFNFDTSNVTNMRAMFSFCGFDSTNVTLDLSSFDTSNVTNMSLMFRYCGYNSNNFKLDLFNFDTSLVQNMSEMFFGCKSLKTIYVSDTFVTTLVISSSDMFRDCTSLAGAVPYDSSKTDASMANYITGYFTYKAPIPLEDDSILFEARNDGQLISLRQEPSTDSDLYGIEFSTKSDLILNLNRKEKVDLELYNLLRDLDMLEDVLVEV